MSWDRRQRQEAILREKIATIVLERLSDPRLGFLTITKVELSKDKRLARVSYTVLGTDAQRRTTQRALDTAAPRIQEILAPSISMRTLPELRFVYAEEVQKESRLLTLLESLEREHEHDADASDADASDDDASVDADASVDDEAQAHDDTAAAPDGDARASVDEPDGDGSSRRS